MDIHCTHLSHKQQRRLRKKLKRQCTRRKTAQLREANSQPGTYSEEANEEEAARVRAEEELEKQRHDEEERQWLERERIAQELFAQKKTLEEAEKRRKLLEETTEIQKEERAKAESQTNEKIQGELLQRLRDGVEEISDNLPPYHRPEPPLDHLFAPPFEPTLKTKELCGFFWKTGACIYGDRCSRFHPIPPIDSADLKVLQSSSYPPCLVLILENMFDNFSLRYDPLEVDESQLQSDYEIFYEDVRPEIEVICGGTSALRCCRNAADHLRGNVYVQLADDATMAIAAATRLNGRWYAGRQITARLAYLGGGWKAAVCGLYLRELCPKGDRRCNFLHLFLNPRESSGDLLAALNRGLAELPARRKEKKRASRERSRGKDSNDHRRKRRRSSSSHSDSRRRHRHRRKKRHHQRELDERRSRSRSRSSSASS